MTPYQKRLTRITRRMADDMKIRNLAQATIDAYTYHVGRFADFLGRPVTEAQPEDIRDFQLHLIGERKVGWSNTRREGYLERCAIQLQAHSAPLPDSATQFDLFLSSDRGSEGCEADVGCPVCGRRMRLVDRCEKPSWPAIMASRHRPSWYHQDSY